MLRLDTLHWIGRAAAALIVALSGLRMDGWLPSRTAQIEDPRYLGLRDDDSLGKFAAFSFRLSPFSRVSLVV
jgi:hypothetical protein